MVAPANGARAWASDESACRPVEAPVTYDETFADELLDAAHRYQDQHSELAPVPHSYPPGRMKPGMTLLQQRILEGR